MSETVAPGMLVPIRTMDQSFTSSRSFPTNIIHGHQFDRFVNWWWWWWWCYNTSQIATRRKQDNLNYVTICTDWLTHSLTHSLTHRLEQGNMLLLCLLEKLCVLYDSNPDKHKRLFAALCQRLQKLGVSSSYTIVSYGYVLVEWLTCEAICGGCLVTALILKMNVTWNMYKIKMLINYTILTTQVISDLTVLEKSREIRGMYESAFDQLIADAANAMDVSIVFQCIL